MKLKEVIIIILCTIISNTVLCQDTAHTRLVDRYYPKSEIPAPEPQNKITPISRNEPLNNSPVQQKPVINSNPISGSVVAQPTQVPDTKTNDITAPVTSVTETNINLQQQKPVVKNDPIISQPTQPPVSNPTPIPATPAAGDVYRDTRLGSSSPQYNTYEKNDNGAGSVTTNPNKNGGGTSMEISNSSMTEPATQNPVQDRNRLGSSSPQYNTYEKNNYGAGSVTTSPK